MKSPIPYQKIRYSQLDRILREVGFYRDTTRAFRLYKHARFPATLALPAESDETVVDPSYFNATINYLLQQQIVAVPTLERLITFELTRVQQLVQIFDQVFARYGWGAKSTNLFRNMTERRAQRILGEINVEYYNWLKQYQL